MPRKTRPRISENLPIQIEEQFVTTAFPGIPAIRALTQEESQLSARKLLADSKGFEEIDQAMRQRGLVGMVSRARAYAPFSKVRGYPKLVAIIPYTSMDIGSSLVGGLGLSDGEPASAVIVDLRGSKVQSFTTLDFIGAELIERQIISKELIAQGPSRYIEDQYSREEGANNLTVDDSATIAGDAFRMLLFDEHSTLVHSVTDLREIAFNAPLVSAIAELQYLRLEGISFSPKVSCCCCCCCCWGSCSSCSATATTYVNRFYEQK